MSLGDLQSDAMWLCTAFLSLAGMLVLPNMFHTRSQAPL